MALDIAAVQAALAEDGLDGWLLYDFHGIQSDCAQPGWARTASGKMTTRRWYYMVPATGEPRALVHAIEPPHARRPAGATRTSTRDARPWPRAWTAWCAVCRAWRWNTRPENANPYLARVDAGTVESIRRRGVDVVSSGDLVQRFAALWDADALATHLKASESLYRIKDRAFAAIAERVKAGRTFDRVRHPAADGRLVPGRGPDRRGAARGGRDGARRQPALHAAGDAAAGRIGRDELVLLDLWGKLREPGAVYADITWVGFTGSRVPEEYARAFDAIVARARRGHPPGAATPRPTGTTLRGWQVDRAARQVLEAAGYGAHVLHRTGHNLGVEVHGNGVHMDDYETHDDRRLLAGTGFTIEPGVYFDHFGVRTEVNMFVDRREARVSGPAQAAIITLA